MPRIANLALLLAAILLSLGLGELALRAFTPFPIHGGEANRVLDPDLGYSEEARRSGLGHRVQAPPRPQKRRRAG
jgi:hypothetical protein